MNAVFIVNTVEKMESGEIFSLVVKLVEFIILGT